MTDLLVADLLRRLAAGEPLDALRDHPALRADARAALARAAELLGGPASEGATLAPSGDAPAEAVVTLVPLAAEETGGSRPTSQSGARRVVVPGYEVLEELGRGGMGVVYKARQVKLNRTVALKMILAGDHASPEVRGRFEREAEAVAALQHPNVVQVFEVGEHNGHSFLALELVPGGSLASWLSDEPWPAEDAAELVEKLARAVHAAHRKGIVHRDLKPENVLLTDSGEPKVTDFGLAKRLDDSSGRTRTGEVMGTPHYMAPEQAAAKKNVGPEADVWGLGAILYRLLAGKVPFDGPNTLDVLMRVLEEEPRPLHERNGHVPADLEAIVSRCLEKDPDRRYGSAARLADDLGRFRRGEPVRARRLSWVERAWRAFDRSPGKAVMWGGVAAALLFTSLATLAFGSGLGVGVVLASGVLVSASLVARKHHMGWGALAGVAVAAGLGAWALSGGPMWDWRLEWVFGLTRGRWREGHLFVVWGCLTLLPVFAGVAVGGLVAARWGTRLLGVGLVLVAMLMAFPYSVYVPLAAALVAVYIGGLTRLACRWWGGEMSDVLLGVLLGALGGAMCVGVGAVPGSVLGAWIVTVSNRKKGPR